MSFTHPARAVHLTAMAIGIAGVLSANARLHAFLVTLIALLLIAGALSPELDAGWLARP
jgi:ribose/xylose/arabinose/galactoside ABC-type transport system permease subunit